MVILRTSYGRSGIRCHASFITRQRHRTGGKVTVKQLTMKHVLFFAALCCAMLFQTLNAQDIIVTKQATRIDAKILEVSDTEVRYKKTSNMDGPTFVMSTSEISSILYANGEVMVMGKSDKANTAKYDDKPVVMLHREFDEIISNDGNEVPNLKEIIGEEQYLSYIEAQKQYQSGDNSVTIGWLFFLGSCTCCAIGLYGENTGLLVGGALVEILSDVLLISGYVGRGVAAGKISRIAEGYNASHQLFPELSLSMSPTLMNNHGQIAPGVGLTLRF